MPPKNLEPIFLVQMKMLIVHLKSSKQNGMYNECISPCQSALCQIDVNEKE